MNIENLLNDVGVYFKNKILTGDYKFIKCGECTAEIIVDEKYSFEMCIANTPKEHFRFYENTFLSSLDLESMHLKTQKERMLGWKHIKPHVNNYRDKVLKREKQKQINRLKKELEALT
jgi:hypothetical protein